MSNIQGLESDLGILWEWQRSPGLSYRDHFLWNREDRLNDTDDWEVSEQVETTCYINKASDIHCSWYVPLLAFLLCFCNEVTILSIKAALGKGKY